MYQCSECRREIGNITDVDANRRPVPAQFKCPNTGRVATLVATVRR